MGLITSKVRWLGAAVVAAVEKRIDTNMRAAGQAIVTRAQQLAPVRTGRLRAGIGFTYRQSDKVLSIYDDVPWAIFQEFGTRNMRAQPFIRPALNSIGRQYGFSIEMAFLNTPKYSSPILAHKGKYIIPSAIQAKPLTAKQKHHVTTILAPQAKRLHTGNVRRAGFRVGRRS